MSWLRATRKSEISSCWWKKWLNVFFISSFSRTCSSLDLSSKWHRSMALRFTFSGTVGISCWRDSGCKVNQNSQSGSLIPSNVMFDGKLWTDPCSSLLTSLYLSLLVLLHDWPVWRVALQWIDHLRNKRFVHYLKKGESDFGPFTLITDRLTWIDMRSIQVRFWKAFTLV